MKKEENVLKLFFNEPTKYWHFEEILKSADISRPQANLWLKKFVSDSLLLRIKPKDKMPYYTANVSSSNYQNKKKLFALNAMNESGLLMQLSELPNARAVIIFGSFSRWDWYKDSDIDIFIYAPPNQTNPSKTNISKADLSKFRKYLHREIQIFICKNKSELKQMNQKLLRNILEGYLVKGNLEFIKVSANA